MRAQHQRELGALEERLKAQHRAETASLQAQQRGELEELRLEQQEQVSVCLGCGLVLRLICTFSMFCSCPYRVQQSMLVCVCVTVDSIDLFL